MLKLNGTKTKTGVSLSNKNSNNRNTKDVSRKPVVKPAKNVKTLSAGVINYTKPSIAKPKKTTQSDLCFDKQNVPKRTLPDYCKKCGDCVNDNKQTNFKSSRTGIKDEEFEDDKGVIAIESENNTTSTKSSSNSNRSSSSNKEKFSGKKSATTITSKTLTNRPGLASPKISFTQTSSTDIYTSPGSGLATPKMSFTQTSSTDISKGTHIKQFYKNENFGKGKEKTSVRKIARDEKCPTLDPIKEMSETTIFNTEESSEENSSEESTGFETIYKKRLDEQGRLINDPDDYDTLQQLRDFRNNNYFECHSADTRLSSKASTTSIGDHKCIYRFYLNDRLFPEPLNADHNNTIRCTICLLPLDIESTKNTDAKHLNGTIQAKVKLGSSDKAQDLVLVLPVTEPLIIREKRKEKKPIKEEEVVYFGVIKFNSYSQFTETLPIDSLALKYQRGYKENVTQNKSLQYADKDECELIVI